MLVFNHHKTLQDRQSELDNTRVPTFTQMMAVPYISNRFALERFLGLSKEEVAENERLWREENDETLQQPPTDASAEMRTAGVSGAGIADDLGGIEDEMPEGEDAGAAGEGTPPETVTDPGAGGGAEADATQQTV